MGSMIKDEFLDFEDVIMNILKRVLMAHSSKLKSVGLNYQIRDIKRVNIEEKYTSEFCVDFYCDKKLEDIIEGFVFLDGNRNTNPKDFQEWLNDMLEDIIRSKDRKM